MSTQRSPYVTALDALQEAQNKTDRLMDVVGVDKDSALYHQIWLGFSAIYDSLEDAFVEGTDPDSGKQGESLVIPIPGKDMREWPTTDKKTARQAFLNSGRYSKIASIPRFLAPEHHPERRAILASEYLELLDKAVGVANASYRSSAAISQRDGMNPLLPAI